MIYELKVYHCMPGRLPALVDRFDTLTVPLWENRYGIRQVGFWTTMVGESNQDLTYMLAWETMEERDKKMAAFSADPEWMEKRPKTERDGQLIASVSNTLLLPTKFSAAK